MPSAAPQDMGNIIVGVLTRSLVVSLVSLVFL
jgi:hypothetical protein